MAILLAEVSVLLYGKYVLQVTGEYLYTSCYHRFNTGESTILTVFVLLALPDKP
jgi:hypothetical protein